MKRVATGICLVLTLAITGCGSDDKENARKNLSDALEAVSKAEREARKAQDGADEFLDELKDELPNADDLPSFEPKEAEFEKADATLRVLNYFVNETEGQPLDLYWGSGGLQTGKKFLTLEYGELSDPIDVEIESNPLFENEDAEEGTFDTNVTIYAEGEDDPLKSIHRFGETTEPGTDYLLILGWDEGFQDGPPGLIARTVELSNAEPATDGNALVYFDNIGAEPVNGFTIMGMDDPCEPNPPNSSSAASINMGVPHSIAPGAHTFFGYSANTECENKSEPVEATVAAGEVWFVFTYGYTEGEIKTRALKVL